MRNDWARFEQLRTDLFEHMRDLLEVDGHCKSYEGAFTVYLPNMFDDRCAIELDCYLLGPHRHYRWESTDNFNGCLDKAEKDIRDWMKEKTE